MNIFSKAGLLLLVLGCGFATVQDGIRILAMLCTVALLSYISDARRLDRR